MNLKLFFVAFLCGASSVNFLYCLANFVGSERLEPSLVRVGGNAVFAICMGLLYWYVTQRAKSQYYTLARIAHMARINPKGD